MAHARVATGQRTVEHGCRIQGGHHHYRAKCTCGWRQSNGSDSKHKAERAWRDHAKPVRKDLGADIKKVFDSASPVRALENGAKAAAVLEVAAKTVYEDVLANKPPVGSWDERQVTGEKPARPASPRQRAVRRTVMAYLEKRPGQVFGVGDLAKALAMPGNIVGPAVWRAAKTTDLVHRIGADQYIYELRTPPIPGTEPKEEPMPAKPAAVQPLRKRKDREQVTLPLVTWFREHPNEPFHVKEIANETGVPEASVNGACRRMLHNKMLDQFAKGTYIYRNSSGTISVERDHHEREGRKVKPSPEQVQAPGSAPAPPAPASRPELPPMFELVEVLEDGRLHLRREDGRRIIAKVEAEF